MKTSELSHVRFRVSLIHDLQTEQGLDNVLEGDQPCESTVVVDDQRDVMTLITDIKAAAHRREQVEGLADIVERLREKGAGSLLIACTELSVIAGAIQATLPVFDASEILARAIVRSARSSWSEA